MDSRCISETELASHASTDTMEEAGHISKKRGEGERAHVEHIF